MSDESANETYDGFTFTVEIIKNGYILNYKSPSTYQTEKMVYYKFADLLELLKYVYGGDWK